MDFVRQLLSRQRDTLRYREKIAPAEANMVAALRNLAGGPMANDVAAVFRALEADGGDLAPEVTEEMRRLTMTSPARVVAFVFNKLSMLPASVQHALWRRLFESILPAEGLQHAGLPPDVITSYLSAPAYYAYRARTQDHNRRITGAAQRALSRDGDDERVDIATLMQFDHATRRYVPRDGVVLDLANEDGDDTPGRGVSCPAMFSQRRPGWFSRERT